jgi:hypothetical protein
VSATGYKLITPTGDRVGKVCEETDDRYVVACGGPLRKSVHVLPKEHAWIDETRKELRLVVPRERLLNSPPAEPDGSVDEAALQAYWHER